MRLNKISKLVILLIIIFVAEYYVTQLLIEVRQEETKNFQMTTMQEIENGSKE